MAAQTEKEATIKQIEVALNQALKDIHKESEQNLEDSLDWLVTLIHHYKCQKHSPLLTWT